LEEMVWNGKCLKEAEYQSEEYLERMGLK